MIDWKNWWKKNEKHKNGECGCGSDCKDNVSGDCTCGCASEARDSVRLTDAEIARDVIYELNDIIKEYESLSKSGCDCAEKLNSCEETVQRLNKFIGK